MAKVKQNPVEKVKEFFSKYFTDLETPIEIFGGIDPGSEGAIAFLIDDDPCVIDIPTYKVLRNKKQQTEFDRDVIIRIFATVPLIADVTIGTERPVPSMGGSKRGKVVRGKASPFASVKLGISHAMWPLFLEDRGYKVIELYPQQWKRKMNLNSNKKHSLNVARRLYPTAELHLEGHHNRAEALLLARHVKETYAFVDPGVPFI